MQTDFATTSTTSKRRKAVARAVELLRQGEIVAIPTETVYGLAADALNPIAVAKIFEAKELSAHPVFAQIASALDKPLAAPSANRFGRISPTTAQHVFDELDGRIPLIIDAGPPEHGIESTIVTVRDGGIEILRRGPITEEQLRGIGFQPALHRQDVDATIVAAPGQLPSHYAPATPLRLIDNAETYSPPKNQRVGFLAWSGRVTSRAGFVAIRNLSARKDLREAATNLFRHLRELDALGLDLIVAERVPSRGLGAAIMDRLERASHR